jgi:superfamily II DNA helicase RecQ
LVFRSNSIGGARALLEIDERVAVDAAIEILNSKKEVAMSSKLFVLAALLVLPLTSQAQAQERDMHVFQDCPSSSYEACLKYQKTLAAHVNRPEFERVRATLQKQLNAQEARELTLNISRIAPESVRFNEVIAQTAKEQASAMKTADGAFLWNEGVMGDHKEDQIRSRITVLRANAKLVDETSRHQMLQRANRLQKILDGEASKGSIASAKAAR